MATPANIHWEIAAALNKRDFDHVRQLMHPDFTYTGTDGKEIAGAQASMEVAERFIAAFPDAVMNISRVFTEGDIAIAEGAFIGTHRGDLMGIAPTGKRVEIRVCNIMELRDGKVYREHEYFDVLNVMVQLGAEKMPSAAAVPA